MNGRIEKIELGLDYISQTTPLTCDLTLPPSPESSPQRGEEISTP
jgi:hypothetical protein